MMTYGLFGGGKKFCHLLLVKPNLTIFSVQSN